MKNRRLHIHEGSFELDITYRWFTPMAFFLVFFCLFWDGFLIVWYGLGLSSGGDMPLMFFLFPLIHVAVGIGLTYYTICLFTNTTYITADASMLRVKHGPLPWPRGNKEIPVRDLEQLFVRRKENNKGQPTFSLEAQLKLGNEQTILSGLNVTATELQLLEQSIESYLGIADQPVLGEYGDAKPQVTSAGPSRVAPSRTDYAGRMGIEMADLGHFLMYEGRTFEVMHRTQYEWRNGNVDRMLQLSAPSGKQALVYVEQDKGLYHTFLEVAFSRAQLDALGFNNSPTPHRLSYDGVDFEQLYHQFGEAYISRRSTSLVTEQWIYRTAKGDEQLRIVNNEGMLSVYFGQREIPAAFGEVLAP